MTHEEIKTIIQEVLKEQRDEFWVPQPQHYLDHEMLLKCRHRHEQCIKNNEWVTAVRQGTKYGKLTGLGFIITATLGFIVWAIAQSLGLWKE